MGRIIKCNRSRQFGMTPCQLPLNRYALERKDWEHAKCSVCLEAPHNAVLLLCSSHDKGCRPYMCGTSFRHSNCLDLFKKAYAKPSVTSASALPQAPSLNWPSWKKSEPTELSCPLCRGQVKGWTVVDPARRYLNKKKRSCVQDGCSFTGTYKQLRKHVRAEHRRAKPRKVDPVLEAKWRALEMQSEQQDVMSTIRSSMPRSVVLGDYVIDMDSGDSDMDDFDDGDDDGDEFDDYGGGGDGGDRVFLQGRRGNNDRISRNILYLLLSQGAARFSRVQRDSSTHDEGGRIGGPDVAYQSEDDGGGRRVRVVNVHRDGRRRETRRRQARGRARSLIRW